MFVSSRRISWRKDRNFISYRSANIQERQTGKIGKPKIRPPRYIVFLGQQAKFKKKNLL